jgi:hypothetical protein
MKTKNTPPILGRIFVGGTALLAAAYASYAGLTWLHYGTKERRSRGEELDSLLDLYTPDYEVVERHHLPVAAPAEVTFAAACEMDASKSRITRAIFKGRELALRWSVGNRSEEKAVGTNPAPKELLESMKAIGWGVLAEIPGHEIVLGAVTQPWVANPVFEAIRPEQFASFKEPGYVKIAWMIRTDAVCATKCIARTETRATATNAIARSKFRRYWSLFAPGIVLIRQILLGGVKREAERRAHAVKNAAQTAEFAR